QLERLLEKGMQAKFSPRLPSLHFGFGDGLLRYNRVEGLSPGSGLVQELGKVLSVDVVRRIGTADGYCNGEVALSHDNGWRAIGLGAYRRLAAANDWGKPLGVGASLQAFLFGRDEGFYYRTTGAELIVSGTGNPYMEWRLFGEKHSTAHV